MILTGRRALQGLRVESERHAYELYYEYPSIRYFHDCDKLKGTRGGIRRLALSFYRRKASLPPLSSFRSICQSPLLKGTNLFLPGDPSISTNFFYLPLHLPLEGFHMTS
jgi:hypothetical protein